MNIEALGWHSFHQSGQEFLQSRFLGDSKSYQLVLRTLWALLVWLAGKLVAEQSTANKSGVAGAGIACLLPPHTLVWPAKGPVVCGLGNDLCCCASLMRFASEILLCSPTKGVGSCSCHHDDVSG